MDDIVRIGKTTKTHGINGEILIKFEAGKLPASEKEPVFLDFEGIRVPFFIENMRSPIDTEWYVVFEEVDNKTKAEKLVGVDVYVQKKNLVTDSNVLLIDNLVGYQVFDTKKGFIGILDYIQKGAQDLMIISNNGEEIYVPFVDEFIAEIIHEKKHILINTPDGLLDLNKRV